MSKLHELGAAYVAAKTFYDNLSMANQPAELSARVDQDLQTRIAMKAMLRAQDEYNAALDAEAERRLSESTVVGIAAE